MAAGASCDSPLVAVLEAGTLGLFGRSQGFPAHAIRVIAEPKPDAFAIAAKRAPAATHFGSVASAVKHVKESATLGGDTLLLVAVNLSVLDDNDFAILVRFIVHHSTCCRVRFFLWAQLYVPHRVEAISASFKAGGLSCRQFAVAPSSWSPFDEHAVVWTNTEDKLFCGETQLIWGPRLRLYAPVLCQRLLAASDCIAAPWKLQGDNFEGWMRKQAFGFLGPPGAAGLPCVSSLASGGVAPRFLWPSEAERILGWESDLSACIPKLDGQSLSDRRKRRLQVLLYVPSSPILALAARALCPVQKADGSRRPRWVMVMSFRRR